MYFCRVLFLMAKKDKDIITSSTEEKILEAARVVFTKKGFAGTRTRDIAELSGINLALLNYYFRSKEKLFKVVMIEKMQKLFGVISPALNDANTTLEQKVTLIVNLYADMLIKNPDLPIFVLRELNLNSEAFGSGFHPHKMLSDSFFVKQLKEKRPDENPLQFLISILGMIIFPFIAKPIFKKAIGSEKAFEIIINERRALIPKWVSAMLRTK